MSNGAEPDVVGSTLAELADEFEIHRPDGTPYSLKEWPLSRSLASGEKIVGESFYSSDDEGRRVWFSCACSPLHDKDGKIIAAVATTLNVSSETEVTEHLTRHSLLLGTLDDAVVGTDALFRITLWNPAAERLYGYSADEVLGRDARDVATYEGEQSRVDLEFDLLDAGRSRTEMRAIRPDGSAVDVELSVVAVRGEGGQVAGYLGVHHDITARKRAQAEAGRRERQQELIAALGVRALARDDLVPLMDRAAGVVASTLELELVGIAELLPGGEQLVLRAGVGWDDTAYTAAPSSAGAGSMVGYALEEGGPVVSEDLATENRFTISPMLASHRPSSGLCVVVAGAAGPYGALAAFDRETRSFSSDDVTFLQSVANVLALAVERSRYELKLIEVRENERSRIARDLHDEAMGGLSFALAEAQRLSAAAAGPDRPAERLVGALKRVGRQLSGAIYDLRLGAAEDQPFVDLLEGMVRVHRDMGVDCEVALDVADGVPTGALGPIGSEVLRIVGEALTNARRHSGAGRVEVTAWGSESVLGIEVSDDGKGFDSGERQLAGRGLGIETMHERAALLGGALQVVAEPGGGTRVRLEVALREDSSALRHPVRVLLVEDHAAVREGIAAVFDHEPGYEVVGQAASLEEARTQLEGVDVAVVDLGLPDGFGGDLISDLREVNPGAHALVLSASLDRDELARAVESGAGGALNKTVHLDEVVEAVRRLQAGEMLMPLDEVVELLRFAGRRREREHADRTALEQLTPRQLEVLQGLADGLDSQAIANRLHISLPTERNHVANILSKLNAHSRLQALVFALRYGAVEIRKQG